MAERERFLQSYEVSRSGARLDGLKPSGGGISMWIFAMAGPI